MWVCRYPPSSIDRLRERLEEILGYLKQIDTMTLFAGDADHFTFIVAIKFLELKPLLHMPR